MCSEVSLAPDKSSRGGPPRAKPRAIDKPDAGPASSPRDTNSRVGRKAVERKSPLTITPVLDGDTMIGRTAGSNPATGAKFDRNAYQREYMRNYRRRQKEKAK